MVKSPFMSKTIWVGLSVTLFSVASIMIDIWGLMGVAEQEAIRSIFGPHSTALIGIVIILLRVITTRPIVRGRE